MHLALKCLFIIQYKIIYNRLTWSNESYAASGHGKPGSKQQPPPSPHVSVKLFLAHTQRNNFPSSSNLLCCFETFLKLDPWGRLFRGLWLEVGSLKIERKSLSQSRPSTYQVGFWPQCLIGYSVSLAQGNSPLKNVELLNTCYFSLLYLPSQNPQFVPIGKLSRGRNIVKITRYQNLIQVPGNFPAICS